MAKIYIITQPFDIISILAVRDTLLPDKGKVPVTKIIGNFWLLAVSSG